MASGLNGNLSRKQRAALPPGERQSIVKNLVVEHDRFMDAFAAIGSFHMPVKGGEADFGVLTCICGDSRTGKTFVLERYARQFVRSEGEAGVIRPVVYVDMPIDCNLRSMAEQIANALNVNHTQRMNNAGLVGAVLKALKKQEVQFLILDEFQEAFDVNRKKTLKDARGLLRKILNLRSLNICVGGLVDTYELLANDAQLKGRGLLPHHMVAAYDWDDVEDRKLFRLLCDFIDDLLPFREKSSLGSLAVAQRLYWVTDGVIGLLKEFVFAAACRAINAGADSIENKHFSEAWDIRKPIGQQFNPFNDAIEEAPPKNGATAPAAKGKKITDNIFSKA